MRILDFNIQNLPKDILPAPSATCHVIQKQQLCVRSS